MLQDNRYKGLTDTVMARIAKRRIASFRAAAALHGSVLLAAIIGLIPAFRYASASAAQSGFSQYISLIASDGGSLIAYWKQFSLIILESAPLVAGAIMLGILLIVAYTARKMAADIGHMRVAAV